MYRFHQLLTATLSPHKALQEREPSPAMLGGILCEAAVATKLGFEPWLPEGVTFTEEDMPAWDAQAERVAEVLRAFPGIQYQPALAWPSSDLFQRQAEGHPDFGDLVNHHLLDLKTTEYPTEELLEKYLYSVQMCAYMAAYKRQFTTPPRLTIILASRLVEPDPVQFNKNGTVSLSGQNADHASLMEAVTAMGDKADDRHWAMVYKAPVWNPVIVGTLEPEECLELAKVGEIFLDAGLAILETGLAERVIRPYA